MRLGVLDIGSNTVHLLVVDAHPGAPPTPVHSEKVELWLTERVCDDGRLSESGTGALIAAVSKVSASADRLGARGLLAFATSVVRDAANSRTVLARISAETGVEPAVLSGAEEAALTFLAARRWYGWSAGRLLVMDLGGGSMELAAGGNERPDLALSLPIGAGRLAKSWFEEDPPPQDQVARLRQHVRTLMATTTPRIRAAGWDRAVATSKTFHTLARLARATLATPSTGHRLSREELRPLVEFISGMSTEALSRLEGVGRRRARQLLAGAVVAQEAMEYLDLDVVNLCPWAVREGVILQRLEDRTGPSTPFLSHHPREQAGSKSCDGSPAS